MRPIEIVVLLKKMTPEGQNLSIRQLAQSLGVSVSSVSSSLERSRFAQLVDSKKRRVNVLALREFLIYGIRYVFPCEPGRVVRGVPTFLSATPFINSIAIGSESYVWPSVDGTAKGQKVEPLFGCVPSAAIKDDVLYQLLVIVDALRLGRVREREIAIAELDKWMSRYGADKH